MLNGTYNNLLPEQKNILREFINASESQVKLRNLINEELTKVSTAVNELKDRVSDDIARIKLDEVAKNITPISNKTKVVDNHIVNLLQYYELVNELQAL